MGHAGSAVRMAASEIPLTFLPSGLILILVVGRTSINLRPALGASDYESRGKFTEKPWSDNSRAFLVKFVLPFLAA